jgi:hypothetical protein
MVPTANRVSNATVMAAKRDKISVMRRADRSASLIDMDSYFLTSQDHPTRKPV